MFEQKSKILYFLLISLFLSACGSDPERWSHFSKLAEKKSSASAESDKGQTQSVTQKVSENDLPKSAQTNEKPFIVIFKGPTICDVCDTPFADYFLSRGFEVREVGPGESTPSLLKNASLYIVPGGEDVTAIDQAPTHSDLEAIRNYISSGGRYYGTCLGAYWAAQEGTWSGVIPEFEALHLIPAQALELNDAKERAIDISWEGKPRKVYFQDGPSFEIWDSSQILKIYATYSANKKVATFISRYGRGKVGVSGVHIEAPLNWYTDAHLEVPPHLDRDLLDEFVNDLLSP